MWYSGCFFFFGWSGTEFGDFVGFWLFSFTGFWIFWSGFFDILWSWSYFSWGEVKYWRKVWIIVVKFRLVLRVFYWWWWRWRRLSLKRESLLFLHGQWSKHRYWCCFLLHCKGFYWCCILILLWCDQCKFGCFLRICVYILLSWTALVSLSKSPKQIMKIKNKNRTGMWTSDWWLGGFENSDGLLNAKCTRILFPFICLLR